MITGAFVDRFEFRSSLIHAAAALAAILMILTSMQARAEGNVEVGAKIFKKCAACHKIGEGAKNAVGPVLTGVIGRPAGTYPDYKYGKSTREAGEAGLVWSEDLIFDYLVDPKKFLRAFLDNKKAKSKMSFKLKKEEQRRDVIAYLSTFSEKLQ